MSSAAPVDRCCPAHPPIRNEDEGGLSRPQQAVMRNPAPGPLKSQRPKLPRVEILDPLRGFAALSVAWFHFTFCAELVTTRWLKASGEYGWLGVEVFFVISGFVIPYSLYSGGYRPRRHFGRFLAKRMARLEPPYLASIGLVLALWYVSALFPQLGGSRHQFSATQLLLHLGYLNTFAGYEWLAPVYWTLGIEFQFYLFMALVYPLLVARSAAVRGAALAGMAGMALFVHTPLLVFHYLGLFALGALVFQYHAALISRRTFVAAVLLFGVVTAASLNPLIGCVGAATALVIAFVPLPRLPGVRGFVALGGFSYSLYLVHTIIGGPALMLGLKFGAGTAWELVAVAVALGVSLAGAAVFHRLVERSAQRLSSRIKYPSRGAELATTPAG